MDRNSATVMMDGLLNSGAEIRGLPILIFTASIHGVGSKFVNEIDINSDRYGHGSGIGKGSGNGHGRVDLGGYGAGYAEGVGSNNNNGCGYTSLTGDGIRC